MESDMTEWLTQAIFLQGQEASLKLPVWIYTEFLNKWGHTFVVIISSVIIIHKNQPSKDQLTESISRSKNNMELNN